MFLLVIYQQQRETAGNEPTLNEGFSREVRLTPYPPLQYSDGG